MLARRFLVECVATRVVVDDPDDRAGLMPQHGWAESMPMPRARRVDVATAYLRLDDLTLHATLVHTREQATLYSSEADAVAAVLVAEEHLPGIASGELAMRVTPLLCRLRPMKTRARSSRDGRRHGP